VKDNTCRCGQPIPDSKARNPRKWCSEACRVRCHRLDNPKPRKPKAERVKPEPVTQTWDCGYCGTTCTRPATRGQKPRWCSVQCRHNGGYQKNICVECGAPGVRNDSVRCSDCATLRPAQRRRATERATRIAAAHRRLDKAAQGTAGKSTKADIACLICNTRFIATWWGTSTNHTCSEQCAQAQRRAMKRIGRDRRRASQRDAYVAPVYRAKIYQRDGYRCHLCNKKVNQDAVVPHPMAPTIDHLVPLASGGTHEPANVATAHFICNSRKGDRGAGEQLALIG
jgi:hypothetical protein